MRTSGRTRGPAGAPAILILAMAVTAIGARTGRAQQGAQTEPELKYPSRSIKLPFGSTEIGVDDDGDIVGSEFVYRVGDRSVGFFKGPEGDPAKALAVNSKGEVLGSLIAPRVNWNQVPPAQYKDAVNSSFFIYSLRDKSYSAVSVFPAENNNGYFSISVMNNKHEFVCCGTRDLGIGGPEATYGKLAVGAPGSAAPPKEGITTKKFSCSEGRYINASSINNAGQVVGTCTRLRPSKGEAKSEGFIYETATGKMTYFSVPGAQDFRVTGINDTGTIAGVAISIGHVNGFIRNSSGTFFLSGSRCLMFAQLTNRGDVVAGCRDGLSIASPPGLATPRSLDAFDAAAKAPFIGAAVERATAKRDEEASSPEKRKKTGMLDANFPHPRGTERLIGGLANPQPGYSPYGIGWEYRGLDSQPSVTYLNPRAAEYLGFDAEGSWFRVDGIPYLWNAQTKTIVEPLHGPAGPLKLPDPSEDQAAQERKYEEDSAKQQTQQQQTSTPSAGSIPYAQNPVITKEADGTYSLSYILRNFNGVDATPIKVKVARPGPKAPNPGLPPPTLGPGNNGSWIWIGDGPQTGMAALFNLDPSGQLTWMFLPPQVAAMYLPSAGKQ